MQLRLQLLNDPEQGNNLEQIKELLLKEKLNRTPEEKEMLTQYF